MFPDLFPVTGENPLVRMCQSAAALGVTALAQTTLVLLLGLLAVWAAGRGRGGGSPLLQAAIGRATLVAVAAVLLLAPLAAATPAALTLRLPGLPQNLLLRFAAPQFSHSMDGLAEASPSRMILLDARPAPGPVATAYVAGFGIYLSGVLLGLAGLAAGGVYLCRISAAGEALPDDSPLVRSVRGLCAERGVAEERRIPRVIVAPAGTDAPFLADAAPLLLPRPTLFVPPEAWEWTDAEARAVLSHETAHLLRRDGAWLLFARVLCALLWVQPLLTVVCRRLEEATEEACDAEALSWGRCDAPTLARCLLDLAERRRHAQPIQTTRLQVFGRAAAVAVGALSASSPRFRSTLGRRVARILSEKDERSAPALSARATVALLTGACAAPLVAVGGVRAEIARPRTMEMRRLVSSTFVSTAAPFPAQKTRITLLRIERRLPDGAAALRHRFRVPAEAGGAPPLLIPVPREGDVRP